MQAKNPKGLDARLNPPADNAAAIPPAGLDRAETPLPPANRLSAAFGAALGGKLPPSHIGPAGSNGQKAGRGRQDQINKAPKPAAGPKRTVNPGRGHR